jgi:thiamine transport system substrate-binding protein
VSVGPADVPALGRLRRPGRAGRAIVSIGVAAALVLTGVGAYVDVSNEYGGPTLVIYTYPSLFGSGNCTSCALEAVFGAFASAHHVRIDLEYPSGTLYSALLGESGAPAADLVIGLDEITAPEAEARGLLVPYSPPELANVSPELVQELSSDDAAVPYEWGYLAIDYNATFYTATGGAVAHLTLPEIAANASWARTFLVEDPTLDITGEEFLLWEIEYYEHVLGENWTTFWKSFPPGTPPLADSWGDAFAEFSEAVDEMVVSYSTDPAYAAYYGASGDFNATGSWWNGTQYGWRTIYGIGIVQGTRHLALDEELEDWFLSGAVQREIPTNEWEYPANNSTPLPSVFADAIPPSSIVPLNQFTTPAATAASMPAWLAEWSAITGG